MFTRIENARLFLCYAKKDVESVSALYYRLVDAGFRPWIDIEDILPGEIWEDVIMRAIREAPFFLACLSRNSVDQRGTLRKEINKALEIWQEKLDTDIYFIPIRLEECEVPQKVGKFQWIDLFADKGFEQLVRAIRIGIKRLGLVPPVKLRTEPNAVLTDDGVRLMLQKYDFFAKKWYWMGNGIQHDYDVINNNGIRLVIDHTTNLTWQQSGSDSRICFDEAKEYIAKINDSRYGGFTEWRLPTLEEAISLMESQLYHNLHISDVFDEKQIIIWTSDFHPIHAVWCVDFYQGTIFCDSAYQNYECKYSVRAVR